MPNQLQFNIEEINATDPGGVRGVVATSVVEAFKQFGILRGTTAERNATLGIPTSPADQLALQGREWQNTELGYTEAYYAQYSGTTNRLGAMRPGWYYHSGPQPTINRRQASTITVSANQEANIIYSTDIESAFPALDWSNGYFIANRPVRVSFEFTVNAASGTASYANTYLRRSTRSALATRQRVFKYGARVDGTANVNPVNSGEVSMDTDQALSIGLVISNNGQVSPADDGAYSSNYIILRELPTPPRVVNW